MREVKKPRNPRTNAQVIQRAIMATVMQAYSKGKAIFDHSFQGKSVGSENQREFMSLNATALRRAIARGEGYVVAPNALTPVPNAYIVSRGNYPDTLFSKSLNTVENQSGLYIPEPLEDEKLQDYITRCNLISGDIYTIVMFAANTKNIDHTIDEDYPGATQYSGAFGFIRLTVKDLSALSSEELADPVQGVQLLTLFDVVQSSIGSIGAIDDNVLLADYTSEAGDGFGPGNLFDARNGQYGPHYIGCIRSREDSDLRSNCTLQPALKGQMIGIDSANILPVWKADSSDLGASDLILEGGYGDDEVIQPNPQISSLQVNGTPVAAGASFRTTAGSKVMYVYFSGLDPNKQYQVRVGDAWMFFGISGKRSNKTLQPDLAAGSHKVQLLASDGSVIMTYATIVCA